MKHIIFLSISIWMLIASCRKDNVTPFNENVRGEVTIEFDNIAGGEDIQLNTASYTNGAGEDFVITKLKYYVSNFIFTSKNGNVFVVPQDSCYFLIDESDISTHKPKIRLPEGEYSRLTFTIGVDSLRNTMDVSERTGVLDPTTTAADMYWSWNSGYIFFKLEGISPVISSPDHVFNYHIGGFGGYNTATPNNLRTITLDLTQRGTVQVKAGHHANVHLFVDILKMLKGTTTMSFANTPMIHSPVPGQVLADNYAYMISHDHTEN